MKKLLTIAAAILFSGAVCAQNDVTKFLGIPVDGTKSEMIQKLKEKGFKYNSNGDCLEGEFNGKDVYIFVRTNNNKVYCIAIVDVHTISETAIKIRFNKLCEQFQNNSKYLSLSDDYTISDKENICYEMSINKKHYNAHFVQVDIDADVKEISSILKSKYTPDELANPTKEQAEDIKKIRAIYTKNIENRLVWFTISEHYGEYRIYMFYENKLNEANGEDL